MQVSIERIAVMYLNQSIKVEQLLDENRKLIKEIEALKNKSNGEETKP